MQLIILLTFIILIIGTLAKQVVFGHHFGVFTFDPGINKQQAYFQHLQSPFVLHSLANVQVPSYFGYWSSWEIKQSIPDDRLVMNVEIKGITIYKISIQYFLVQQMPNMEVSLINLTWTKPQKLFTSHKGLIFGQATQLTTHLVGFSNSNFTNQNFFFAMKGKNTYTIYTGINITTDNWVAMNLIILQPSYSKHDLYCFGSHINHKASVQSSIDPYDLEYVPSLPFFVGIEAFYQSKCDFVVNTDTNKIKISSGSYSFNIISINTTCVQISSKKPELSKQTFVYMKVMIIFVFLSGILIIIWLLHCLYVKYSKNNKQQQHNTFHQNNRQQQQKQQDQNVLSSQNQQQHLQINLSSEDVIVVIFQKSSSQDV